MHTEHFKANRRANAKGDSFVSNSVYLIYIEREFCLSAHDKSFNGQTTDCSQKILHLLKWDDHLDYAPLVEPIS